MSLNDKGATMVADDEIKQIIASPEGIAMIMEMMEEMANEPKEEYGKRQPGERGMYEIQRRENLALRQVMESSDR